ncbi:MAG: cupin domain-containing protein [Opitutae bacterium]|nr:cupin domain-containing protein [Opitutae bacterium]
MKRTKPESGGRRPRRGGNPAAAEFPAEFAMLAYAAPAASAPAAGIKRALLAKITAEKRARAPRAARGWRFDSVGRTDGWFAMSFPGVRMKELSLDLRRDSALVLVEIARGGRFPDHEHEFADEGVILSGSVVSGGRRLGAGDYYYAAPGSSHTDIVSAEGCTALVHLSATAWRDLKTHVRPAGA